MPKCARLATLAALSLAAPAALAHPSHGGSEDAAPALTGLAFAVTKASVDDEEENEVTISVQDGVRTIISNGIPDHRPGRFPNRGNPNAISAQRYRYTMPEHPEAADEPTDAMGQPFGIGLNGVPFDPGTAEFWEPGLGLGERGHTRGAWNYEAMSGVINLGLDEHNAHVQPTGAYHYHGVPTGLAFNGAPGDAGAMVMVGYAADGFPMYAQFAYEDAEDAGSEVVAMRPSYQLKEGRRPTGNAGPGGEYDGTFTIDYEYVEGLGDLDECNGRTGVTPEYPGGTYYYVITEAFPHIPRLFKGTPDASFERRRGPGPGRNGPGGPNGERPDGPGVGGPPPDGERPPRRGPGRGAPPRR